MLVAHNTTTKQQHQLQHPLDIHVNDQPHFEADSEPDFDDFFASSFQSADRDRLSRLSASPGSTLSVDFAADQPALAQDLPLLLAAGPDNSSSVKFDPDFDFSMLGSNDLMMQDGHWLSPSHISSGRALSHHSFTHNREPSLSSLGSASAGPASPLSHNTSHPHIAVSDSLTDSFTMPAYYEDPSFSLMKQSAAGAHDASSFYGQGHAAYASPDGLPVVHGAYASSLLPARQRPSSGDRGLQPPPDLAMGPNRSQPVSVASSIASNSPATPSLDNADDEARRRNGENAPGESPLTSPGADDLQEDFSDIPFFLGGGGDGDDEDDECSRFFNDLVAFQAQPKFERNAPDVFSDDIYNPSSFAMPSAPDNSIFPQRLHQLNNQRLAAASQQSSVANGSPRERSPFRQGSPLAPVSSHSFSTSPTSNLRFSQQQRAQIARGQGTSTPQTISPKDAVLDYHEADAEADGAHYSLFSQAAQPGFSVSQMSQTSYTDMTGATGGMPPSAQSFGYMGPQLGSGIQYSFMTQQHPGQQSSHQAVSNGVSGVSSTHSPVAPIRTVTSLASLSEPVPGSQRPGIVNADGGTYTCTYHGCTQRFETQALLQKHKREGHRQANALTGARRIDTTVIAPNPLNSQSGPHRCERINPSTGKPCNTVFSRPYDLTRHEDTIHNARKQKVRCNLCTEEKTFSRADALTRHFRVCHPEVEFAGKHRKRGVHAN